MLVNLLVCLFLSGTERAEINEKDCAHFNRGVREESRWREAGGMEEGGGRSEGP